MPKEETNGIDELIDNLENFDEEIEETEVGETTDEPDEAGTETDVELDTEEPSELELLKAQLAEKDKIIADIAKGIKPEASEESNDLQGFKLQEEAWEDSEFVGEDFDIDTLDQAQLNALLNKVAAAGAARGAEIGAKQVLVSIPGIVKHNISVETSIQSAVKEFYTDNKDLMEFKGAVSAVTQELASSNPEWELTKLFDEAGKETRKRLGIKKTITKSKTKTPSSVRPRGQRGRGKGTQLTGLEAEIGEMMELG